MRGRTTRALAGTLIVACFVAAAVILLGGAA